MTVPISQLPAAPTVNGADIVPIVQSGQTRRTTANSDIIRPPIPI